MDYHPNRLSSVLHAGFCPERLVPLTSTAGVPSNQVFRHQNPALAFFSNGLAVTRGKKAEYAMLGYQIELSPGTILQIISTRFSAKPLWGVHMREKQS